MRHTIRTIVATAAALCATALAAVPAAAHGGSVPFQSEVTTVTSPYVTAAVAQPAHLVVAVEDGHTMELRGYDGEPYLRAGETGGFEVNVNSPAYWLNKDDMSPDPPPAHASSKAAPDWQVATIERTIVIHHHAIHWMSPNPPERDNDDPFKVQDWQVPIVVDGVEETIYGELWFDPQIMNPIGVRYAVADRGTAPVSGGGADMVLIVGAALSALAVGAVVVSVARRPRAERG